MTNEVRKRIKEEEESQFGRLFFLGRALGNEQLIPVRTVTSGLWPVEVEAIHLMALIFITNEL